MRVLLRADASPVQGTGHVMRCLTLSEALKKKGHHVVLMTNESGVPWLEENIALAQIDIVRVERNELDYSLISTLRPDWVVTDSYEISASKISSLNSLIPTMAIIDGDDRGILVSAYLDHNLGAELSLWPDYIEKRILAGSKYVLIRDAVLEQRLTSKKSINQAPHVVAVMGGSDPTGAIVEISRAISELERSFSATVIVGEAWRQEVTRLLKDRVAVEIIPPTTELPIYFGKADIAISASGTSAWELCTLAIPSIMISVVDNQVSSLNALIAGGLVVGIDATGPEGQTLAYSVGIQLSELLDNQFLRDDLIDRCKGVFDGNGKYRVVEFLEQFLITQGVVYE